MPGLTRLLDLERPVAVFLILAFILAVVIAAPILINQVFSRELPLMCGNYGEILPATKCDSTSQPQADPIVEVAPIKHWKQGDQRVRLMEGADVCFLTEVTGAFQGGGELVEVYKAKDGQWFLHGSSKQVDVAASAGCIKISRRSDKRDSLP